MITPLTRPAEVTSLRTAQFSTTIAPFAMAAFAIALLARVGSARPSDGVWIPPYQRSAPPGTSRSISSALSNRESSARPPADPIQVSCFAISASLRATYMMPASRYPTSAPTRCGISAQSLSDSTDSGRS